MLPVKASGKLLSFPGFLKLPKKSYYGEPAAKLVLSSIM